MRSRGALVLTLPRTPTDAPARRAPVTDIFPSRPWIGRWLRGIGVLHTVISALVYRDRLLGVVTDGVINSLVAVPSRGVAVWSLVAGVALSIAGGLVMVLEERAIPIPHWVGWAVLGLGVGGGLLAPISGFWLLLVPAIGVLRQRPETESP